jgi:uncharacterized protein (DUF362 family)
MALKSQVAVLRTTPQTVLADYLRLAELAGMADALAPGVTTILKDNISWHYPMPSANTTPWQLEGTILALRQAGFNDLVCVQNRTVVTSAFKGEDLNGYVPIFRHYGVPVRYNFEPQDMTWVPYRPQAKMLALDKVYPKGIYLPDFFIGKNIVHLPTAKCHIYTTITGAVKNAFGGLLNHHRHYTHSWIHETLVDLLAIQKEIHPGIFAVTDGTFAGDGPGPRAMRPHVKNLILASSDMVAIDAVSAKLMGFDPMSLEFIRLGHEMGLGVGDPREIEVVGLDISNINFGFTKDEDTFASWGKKKIYWGPLHFMEKPLLRSPIVPWSYAASNIFYNLMWYPAIGRGRVKAAKNTEWGKLFDSY